MIKLEGSKLILESFICERGTVEEQEIDLTPFQGQYVRIYLDNDLKLVANPYYDCYWQLAEMVLNPLQTQQVENGTKEIEEFETLYIYRSDTDEDTINDPSGTVESVGFEWQNYKRGSEWETSYASNKLTITWLTERRPREGEEYPVVIKKTREVPDIVSVEVPLDLTKINIITYELPV